MKKLLLIALVLASLVPSFSFAASDNTQCGVDFERSFTAGVPFFYCWGKQDKGDIIIDGLTHPACSGDTCPGLNSAFNLLQQ